MIVKDKSAITNEELDQLISHTTSNDENILESVYEIFGDLARKGWYFCIRSQILKGFTIYLEFNRDPMRNKNLLELCENILSTSNLKLRSMAARTIANLCFNHGM